MPFGEVESNPLYRQVAAKIREAILRGEVVPGGFLPTERELAETFKVSRASIREALRELETQGLITPGRTAQARKVATGDRVDAVRNALSNLLALQQVSLTHLVELRLAIEGHALHHAAVSPVAGCVDEAEAALTVMQSVGVTLSDYDQADIRFHTALVAASGNPGFLAVMLSVRDNLTRFLEEALQRAPEPRAVYRRLSREHEAILNAVRAGDGERAVALCATHVRRFYGVPEDRTGVASRSAPKRRLGKTAAPGGG
jgi:GntR family transcriptional regulator, transcriptional repressor for pyruvate dehydrogenase complex